MGKIKQIVTMYQDRTKANDVPPLKRIMDDYPDWFLAPATEEQLREEGGHDQ